MKKFAILLTLVFCTSAFAQKNVAVLEINRHPEIAAEISHREALEITNVIRGAAVRTLPRGQFSVMTSETVQAMGGAVLAECFDETCVIALGRTIDAEYVMRGSLSKFQTMFTLNIEMFETEYGNLVATSEPVRSENLMDILSISGFATTEMLENFLGTGEPQTVARSQNVRAERPVRESRVRLREPISTGNFFALKWFPPITGYTKAGWAFNLEYGQIRSGGWGDGWFWSIDAGFGTYSDFENHDIIDPNHGNYTGEMGTIAGATYNMGIIHELLNNTYIAYGASVGYWNTFNRDANNGSYNEQNIENWGFGGPFVRLRWNFLEVKYRGLIGYRERYDYWNRDTDDGIGYVSQLMLGLHFSPTRRR